MSVTIYHNPDCGTSRNTLAMIRESGIEPTGDRISKDPAGAGSPGRADRGHEHAGARAAAGKGHALCRARPRRREVVGQRIDRLHDGESDFDQPADRGQRQGRAAVPAIRERSFESAAAAGRRVL